MELPRKKILKKKSCLTVEMFLIVMLIVVGIQGTYLGYTVGILTNLEKRFGIPSRRSGTLLSMYDVGHTIAVVIVGILASNRNLPRITAIGVILSALSMFLLALPVAVFGTASHDMVQRDTEKYIQNSICTNDREVSQGDTFKHCVQDRKENAEAFRMLSTAQLIAGIAAAPFNTIAYVYIDDNLKNKNLSPFYLGLLSSMYAFGPAFGFALSAGLTRVHTTLTSAPPNISITDEEWVGAWWLGFLICGVLYAFCSIPLFFFPKSLLDPNDDAEKRRLRGSDEEHEYENTRKLNDEISVKISCCKQFEAAAEGCPSLIWKLIKNPIFTSMVVAWMFGSYLVGGYSTYLPKYVETQYGRSASIADVYAGIISIGSIAVSTALGGYLLTRFNYSPRKAILFLIMSWSIIVVSFLLGLVTGCDEPSIEQLVWQEESSKYQYMDVSPCSWNCQCGNINHFDPVHFENRNFFSPCHAGCKFYNREFNQWANCECVNSGSVENGLHYEECNQLYAYIPLMFVGLFFGNLFFMTTMMVVLRSVYDYQKVMALSFASCATNILGFIPAPVIFGSIIDSTCLLWHNPKCYFEKGNCVIYNNKAFRLSFHLVSAGIQLMAVIFLVVCYIVSRNRKFPEEEEEEEGEELEQEGFELLPNGRQPQLSQSPQQSEQLQVVAQNSRSLRETDL